MQKPNDHAFSFHRYTRFYRFGSTKVTSDRNSVFRCCVQSTRHLSRMTFSCCLYWCDAAPPFNSSEVLPRQKVPSYRRFQMALYHHSVRSKALHSLPEVFRVWLKFSFSSARVLAGLVLSLAHGPRQFSQPVAITCMHQYIRVFDSVFSVRTMKHLPKSLFALMSAEGVHMPCANFSGCKRWDLMIPSFRHEL